MKKLQKLLMSSLASMMVVLLPAQATFADELITSSNSTIEAVKESRDFSLFASTSPIDVRDSTTDIYFNGVTKINVVGQPEGTYKVYKITSDGKHIWLGTVQGTGTVRTQMYGYHKIYIETSYYGYYTVDY